MAPDRHSYGKRSEHNRFCNCASCTAKRLGKPDPNEIRRKEEFTSDAAIAEIEEMLRPKPEDLDK